MQYIDKIGNMHTGNQYTKDFLNIIYNGTESKFIPSLAESDSAFDSFKHWIKSSQNHPNFTEYLLAEQHGRCCYCMGRLDRVEDVTLEHVIPHSLRQVSDKPVYDQYVKHAPALQKGVKLRAIFQQQYYRSPMAFSSLNRMPHNIAYANLTASCKGILSLGSTTSCCCNNYRKDYQIIPLMLKHNAAPYIVYTPEGNVIIKDIGSEAERKSTMKWLNLDHETLREIRHIWYLISKNFDNFTPIMRLSTPLARRMFLIQILVKNGQNNHQKATTM